MTVDTTCTQDLYQLRQVIDQPVENVQWYTTKSKASKTVVVIVTMRYITPKPPQPLDNKSYPSASRIATQRLIESNKANKQTKWQNNG